MAEKDSDKHVFSYMDGIPVKISEKYKPPRKIVLPGGFQNRLLQPPVSPDYDFQLERDILDKLQQWQSQRSKEKENRKLRLAKEDADRKKMQETMEELEKTMNELSAEEDTVLAQQSSQSASPITASVPIQQTTKNQLTLSTHTPVCSPVMSEGNPILRPIPIKHQVVSSQINNNKPISAFNLSDFEADTSSPFDNMELKTINDLEELAQVLQPVAGSTAVSQMPGYYQNTGSSDESFVNVHHQTMNSQVSSTGQSYNFSSNKMLNDANCAVNYQPHVNGFASNYDYNSVQSYHPQSVIPHLNPHGQVPAYNYVERELLPQSSDLSFSNPHQDTQRQLHAYYSSNVWPSVPYHQARSEPSSYGTMLVKDGNAASSNVPVFNMESSSSAHLNRTEDRSPEADMEPSVSIMAQQLGDLMKSRASRNQPKPSAESTPETSSSVQTPTSPTEADPFESLNTESRHLVQKIAEMGFPRVRVARACLKFGSNDKKIVEFLLTLQSLLDAGYQEGRAENALSLHNQDTNAAIKFLQVESQLLDLGFPANRVSEALMKFNCDRDQALEFLIS